MAAHWINGPYRPHRKIMDKQTEGQKMNKQAREKMPQQEGLFIYPHTAETIVTLLEAQNEILEEISDKLSQILMDEVSL